MRDCIACSGTPVAVVHDGGWRKPICETHERLYQQKGYTTSRPAPAVLDLLRQ